MHSQMPVFICWVYCSRSCWMLVLKMASLARSCCDSESSTFLNRVRLVLYRSRLSLHRQRNKLSLLLLLDFFKKMSYIALTWQLSVPGTGGGSPPSGHIRSWLLHPTPSWERTEAAASSFPWLRIQQLSVHLNSNSNPTQDYPSILYEAREGTWRDYFFLPSHAIALCYLINLFAFPIISHLSLLCLPVY